MNSNIINGITNQVIEWYYISLTKHKDPFNDLELDVIVTSPKNESWCIPAFWKGEQTWAVRFVAQKEGLYKIQTICSNKEDITLHGIQRVLRIKKDPQKNICTMDTNLHICQSNHKFIHQNAEPFFWLGDTWWMGLSKRLNWPNDFQRLTKDRKNKGFSVILLVAGLFPDMDSFDERSTNEAGFPWEKDYARINPSYFDEADKRIQYLISSDLIPCILGSWGYYLLALGEEKMQKHWRYIIARWSAYPIVWCLAGEAAMPYYLSKNKNSDMIKQKEGWTRLGKYIKKIDPFHRLLTVHPIEDGREQITDNSILDFNMIQSGHGGYDSVSNTVRLVNKEKCQIPSMPLIVGEVNYEGIRPDTHAKVQRLTFWSAMLSGASGFTYGANGIWQVNTSEHPFGLSPNGSTWGDTPWEKAYKLEGSTHLGLAKELLQRYDWWLLEPHSEWLVPQGNPLETKTPRIAGIPKKLCILYFYDESHIHSKLKYTLINIEKSITYRAFYWNPRTTEEYHLGIVEADKNMHWTIPRLPTNDDWVLILDTLPLVNVSTPYKQYDHPYIKDNIFLKLKRKIVYTVKKFVF